MNIKKTTPEKGYPVPLIKQRILPMIHKPQGGCNSIYEYKT
jgi:hypothetical protein